MNSVLVLLITLGNLAFFRIGCSISCSHFVAGDKEIKSHTGFEKKLNEELFKLTNMSTAYTNYSTIVRNTLKTICYKAGNDLLVAYRLGNINLQILYGACSSNKISVFGA